MNIAMTSTGINVSPRPLPPNGPAVSPLSMDQCRPSAIQQGYLTDGTIAIEDCGRDPGVARLSTGRCAMAQKDQRTSSNPGIPNMAEFAETGRKQVEAILDMQKKFFDPQEMSRDWSARAKAEADLATAFAEKLSAAKSMPEVAAACQDWMSRRMELFTEDSRRLFADCQKFMSASAQMLSGGWKGGGS